MKLKPWSDCNTVQKITRVVLFTPIALTLIGYFLGGLWLFWAIYTRY